ncbi:hypothetical protein FCJ60_36170 [Burkholderia metallica]|nr:hypothetical protein [Burkholderia metallica]
MKTEITTPDRFDYFDLHPGLAGSFILGNVAALFLINFVLPLSLHAFLIGSRPTWRALLLNEVSPIHRPLPRSLSAHAATPFL